MAGAAGETFYISETHRTEQRQQELYDQGRGGNPGRKVTNCRGADCPHVQDRALDVYPVRNGQPLIQDATPADMQRVGEFGKAAGFEWGGDWGNPDRPHWEVPKR